MVNPRYLDNGQEQYIAYVSNITGNTEVQYDYRHTDGELFSCVKPTLGACRKAKEDWLSKTKEGVEVKNERSEPRRFTVV